MLMIAARIFLEMEGRLQGVRDDVDLEDNVNEAQFTVPASLMSGNYHENCLQISTVFSAKSWDFPVLPQPKCGHFISHESGAD